MLSNRLTLKLSNDKVLDIHIWTNEPGVNKDTIMNKLNENYSETNPSTAKNCTSEPQKTDSPISVLDSIQTILERFNNMELKVDQLRKIVNNLSSVSIPDTAPEITTDKQPKLPVAEKVNEVPDTTADAMPDSKIEELELENLPKSSQKSPLQEKKYDKAKTCNVIVDLKDNKNMTWTEIARELKKMGYTPENENKDTFHHLVVSNLYKYAKKHQLSEPLLEAMGEILPDKQEIELDPAETVDLQKEQVPDEHRTQDTATKPPEWQDRDEYREYTLNLIIELKNKNLALKGIVDKLYEMGVKTRTGKDKWSIGTVGNLLKRYK